MTWEEVGIAAGIVGTLVAIVGLGWQLTKDRGTGRRVKVETSYVIPVYGPQHAPEFHDDDQVQVSVINRGDAPVSVLNFGVSMDGKTHRKRNLFVPHRHPMSAALPAVVTPGGQPVNVHIPVEDLRRIHAEHGISFKQMHPWVELGDGRKVFANKTVPLKP